MRIGIPREIKNNEFRVSLTAEGVAELTRNGHEVLVECDAGVGSGISDDAYRVAGAQLCASAAEVWDGAELILKVKEPQPVEYSYFRPDLVLFTFLHLAADRELTDALIASRVTSFAYETVQLDNGRLPLLAPMSEVAGRLSVLAAAQSLFAPAGGPGLLISGVTGTSAANVVILGGGVAGSNAAHIAHGVDAKVTVLDTNEQRLAELAASYPERMRTVISTPENIAKACREADVVIGSVLVPGAKAPKLVTNDLVAQMKPGSVLVDIAIDQGGCFEDSHPTTHAEPTFRVHNSIFYCVANIPGAVPQTSTYALTHVTLPYVQRIAEAGWRAAAAEDSALARGLTTAEGELLNASVAEAHGL